jgi:integrase
MGTVFKRGEFWYYNLRNEHGKRIKKKVGHSKKLAEEALKAAEYKIARRKHGIIEEKEVTAPIFRDYAEKYLAYSEANKTLKSFQTDRGIIHKYFIPAFGGKPVDQINVEEVEELKQQLLKMWTKGDTVKKMNLLQAMMNRAVRLGYLKTNQLKAVEKVKPPRGRLRYLKSDEKARLFQELTTPWYLMPISLLAVYTGMRRGDDTLIGGVVGLQWEDVDLHARVIHLPTTKNAEPLMVPLSKTVIALLENLPRTSDRLFPGVNGNMVTMAFRRACKRAKVTNFRFHDLRHTFGSYLAMAGYNQRTIQELMGHKDPRMTVIYTQLSEQHKRQAIEGLDEILGQSMC